MTPELLLSAVEAHQTSIREGTDSLVVLYRWRCMSGDDASFAAAVQQLVEQQLIEIMPGEDMRFRLTTQCFERISKVTTVLAEDRADFGGAVSWEAVPVSGTEATPEQLLGTLRDIFHVLNRGSDRAIAADTLLRIWTMEGKNGGDLRVAIDTMIADGDLKAERAGRTAFRLTAQGAARMQGS